MRKLKIDRSIWLRGEGDRRSKLLRSSDQKMCCIGIYLEACGVDREILSDIGDASSMFVKRVLPEEARWLVSTDISPSAESFYRINDCILNSDYPDEYAEISSEEDREQKIKEMFLKHDVEVEFL